MKTVGYPSLFALALLGLAGCQESAQLPNLLLITLDTTRADYIGCYGSPDVQTPNIDRLAAQGVRFTRTIAPSQCTNPSHASILTGLYLAHHNLYDNETRLADEASTLAEILRERGYATLAAVSARHLNPANSNFGQGFDRFLEAEAVLRAGARNEALFRELRSYAERPFFAWVHYFDAHGEYAPPPPYDGLYPRGSSFEPIPAQKYMNIGPKRHAKSVDPDEMIRLYKGEISYMDHQIGALLRRLAGLGRARNTLVILTADHGESLTEKEIYFEHAGMYNQVLHIPFIMRFPGVIPAGLEVDTLTTPVDVFPTALELLGIESPPGRRDGRSLVPSFSDPDFIAHDFVISEAVNGVIRTIHEGEYKYIKPYSKDWSMPEEHLYRPFEDYGESTDLRESETDVTRRLESALDTWLAESRTGALPRGVSEAADEETREALRRLGYLE